MPNESQVCNIPTQTTKKSNMNLMKLSLTRDLVFSDSKENGDIIVKDRVRPDLERTLLT